MHEPVRLGVLGCGNVGSALLGLVVEQRATILDRTGVDLEIAGVAVRDTTKDRGVDVPAELFTADADAVVHDPDVDLVVELVGGLEPARGLVLEALKAGRPVVTGNKELLANAGAELFAAAETAGVDLLFEAAVGGAIPLLRPLRESLVGEDVQRVMGIVNGTTNYILTRMTEDGATYDEALSEAQSLGFAEADPTADVEGFDAAAKAAILASIAFGAQVVADDVYKEGIAHLRATDIQFATRLGYVVKPLAIAERFEGADGPEIAVRTHPAMLPGSHPLAAVRQSFNAVFVEGRAVGELMFYGRGAGGVPTASAVLGDVIDAASNLRGQAHGSLGTLVRRPIRPIEQLASEFYINIEVADRPGVLSRVAGVFGDNGVSIRSMEQEGLRDDAQLIFITHLAVERDVQATLRGLRDLDEVRSVGSVVRVVGEEDAPAAS